MTTTQTTPAGFIPCGRCNGAEYTGAGYDDADHCGSCTNGTATCFCGEPATHRYRDEADGEPLCEAHYAEDDEPVPAPADPGRTVRIPVETMRQVVFGGAL